MPATKSGSVLVASGTSNAAGGTTTSTALDLRGAYGALLNVQVTNGATAPTAACMVTINTSPDGVTWGYWTSQAAGLTANATTSLSWEIPFPAMFLQVVFSGNTGSAVTVAAQIQVATGL